METKMLSFWSLVIPLMILSLSLLVSLDDNDDDDDDDCGNAEDDDVIDSHQICDTEQLMISN
jgi:hypothetical protein